MSEIENINKVMKAWNNEANKMRREREIWRNIIMKTINILCNQWLMRIRKWHSEKKCRNNKQRENKCNINVYMKI